MRRKRLQDSFRAAVDTALREKAQLFLIAGDLFDRPDPRNAERLFVACELARLGRAGIAVVAICGNHDSPRSLLYGNGAVPLHEMAALGGLHLLRDDREWDGVCLNVTGDDGSPISVRVRGQSHAFHHGDKEDPLATWCAGLSDPDARAASVEIALLHYAVEGWEMPQMAEAILPLASLQCIAADLIAVGHLHVRNETRLPGGALLLNPGATERMDFGEEKHHCGCYVVRFEPSNEAGKPAATRYEYAAITPQAMRTVAIEDAEIIAGSQNDSTEVMPFVCRRLDALLAETPDAEDSLLRVQFIGVLPDALYHALDVSAVRQYLQDRCFHADISLDELAVRYADMTLTPGSGGFEIETEIEAIVTAMLAQIPETDDRKRKIVLGAQNTLLAAYQRVGGN